MIRRLFWAALGAALGITGYRRVSRRLAALARPGRSRLSLGAAGFGRDVRDGMAEYMARHSVDPAPTLGVQQVGARRPGEAGISRRYPGSDYAKDGH